MKSKVKIYLHGKFGQEVGPEWDLYVNTPAEGLRLIEANTKKCIKFLADTKERNVNYAILVGDKPISAEEELNCSIGKNTEIHFIPLAEGAKTGFGKILAGIALIVAVFVFQQYWLGGMAKGALFGGVAANVAAGTLGGYIAGAALMTGISLIAGGVTQLIVGNPNSSGPSSEENQPSYLFNGPVNTTRQGNPVPICYGRMLCGSSLITLEVNSSDISVPVVDTQVGEDEYDSFSGGGHATSSSEMETSPYITDSPFKRISKPQELD